MRLSWFAMCLAVGWSGTAWAAPYYIEGPAYSKRAEAARQARAVPSDEVRSRVVRRYRQGEGWEFLARVEGLDDEEAARALAAELASTHEADFHVFDVAQSGEEAVTTVRSAAPSAREGEVSAAAPEGRTRLRPARKVDLSDPEAVFARISEAHGGPGGGAATLDAADSVLFKFRRTLPDGLVVEHLWSRKGTAYRLDVRVVQGEGRSSTLLLTPEGAWLAVEEGRLEPTDPDRARETIHRFTPAHQLPFLLVFTRALEGDPTLEVLEADEGQVRLRSAGDRVEGPLRVLIDTEAWELRGVHFEVEDLRYLYSDWGPEGALRLPKRIETQKKGTVTDTVEILELRTNVDPPAGWFTPE